MTRERFIQVLSNLRGYDVRRRIITSATSTWIDQRNRLDHLHPLEKKVFERSIEFFFDSRYGCVVLDDELIASKASDVENKLVTDRKSGGEGPCCDVICDSFFQFMLGMRIRTIADSQIDNMEKLMDTLPPVDNNENSSSGPIIACDRGYGKKKVIELLAKRNFKVITIANAMRSCEDIPHVQ